MIPRVGILDFMTRSKYERAIQASHYAGPALDPSSLPIASPWSSSDLNRIVAEDVFGSDLPINTRAAAMRIPAIARGRNLIVSSICRLPLAAMNAAGERLNPTPTWMTSDGGGSSPQLRLAWTVDDLIFYGWSCWWRDNRSDNFPLNAQRINQGDWSINMDNRVEIHGHVVDDRNVILIPGLHEGILTFGKDTLADARSLYQMVRDRLASPVPPIDLHQTGGPAMTNDEIDEMIARWVAARRAGKAVGYTSQNIEAKALAGGDDASLMIEARNAASLDLARLIGLSAGLVDATVPKASLNYETTSGRNEEFVDRDLGLYMTPIAARLSLDDVMPHGQRAVFDTTDFTAPASSPTGPALED